MQSIRPGCTITVRYGRARNHYGGRPIRTHAGTVHEAVTRRVPAFVTYADSSVSSHRHLAGSPDPAQSAGSYSSGTALQMASRE